MSKAEKILEEIFEEHWPDRSKEHILVLSEIEYEFLAICNEI